MEQSRGGNGGHWGSTSRIGQGTAMREEHNRASHAVLLPAGLNPDSVGAHAHYLYRAAPENSETGSIRVEDMFLCEHLARDIRRTAIDDIISKCKDTLVMFMEEEKYHLRHASKDNYHSSALPITRMVVSKLSQVVTDMENIARMATPGGVIIDPQRNMIHFLK